MWGDRAKPMMEPEYIPLYTRARDRERSPTGTHLHMANPASYSYSSTCHSWAQTNTVTTQTHIVASGTPAFTSQTQSHLRLVRLHRELILGIVIELYLGSQTGLPETHRGLPEIHKLHLRLILLHLRLVLLRPMFMTTLG